ncbi:hypothetical protein E2P81_ATG09493 [Venturia nashicola]|nr:hypothetical protein E2P81_ATG09493 [Venturia nashicola]
MVPSSQTITSYKGNQAAMLGWKLDTTRQVWYRTTVFWDVDDQRLPETPPRHLRKDFVPGQRCPRGEREKFPLIKPRNFVNPIFKDNPTGVSPSFDGSSSSTGSSRTIFHGSQSLPSILDESYSSTSKTTIPCSTSTRSTIPPFSAHREFDISESRRRDPPPRTHLSLPSLEITSPKGIENDINTPENTSTQTPPMPLSGRITATATPEVQATIGDVVDIWNFDQWEAEAARFANGRGEKSDGVVGVE